MTYKLSYRDLAKMMAERHVAVAHITIRRWVPHYGPVFAKPWQRFAGSVGTSWRIDETYIKLKDKWAYRYRESQQRGANDRLFLERTA